MHRDESDQLQSCIDCGAELTPGADRDYEYGPSGILCQACAERRGGRYDEGQSRWVDAPDLSGLADAGYEIE